MKRKPPVPKRRGPYSLGGTSRPGGTTVRAIGPKIQLAVSPTMRAKTREELDEALKWDPRCRVGECVLTHGTKEPPKKKGSPGSRKRSGAISPKDVRMRYADGTIVTPLLSRKATHRVYGNPYGASFYCCRQHALELMKTAPALKVQDLYTGEVL